MKNLNLERIISYHNLDVNILAKQLFPANEWPRPALLRVIKGDALLDSQQVSKLAMMLELTIDQLFTEGSWTARSTDKIHTFTNGEYTAKLTIKTWVTRLYFRGEIFHETVLCAPFITLGEYLEKLDTEIRIKRQSKIRKDGN